MSEAGKPIEEPAPVTEQDGSIPETVVPAEPVADQPVADQPEPEAPAAETPPAAEAKTKETKKPWFQTRIDELTKQKHDEKRAREAAEARAAVLEAANKSEGDVTSKPSLTQADFDKAVEAKAASLAAAKEQNARAETWLKAGLKEYGPEDFNNRCDMVAAMGAADRPEFMAIITDPEIMPDGHKVVALLADHPEEAERILKLDPMRMAAALTRFAATAEKPARSISSAPRPITPIGGSSKASALSDSDDIKTWVTKRNAEVQARKGLNGGGPRM